MPSAAGAIARTIFWPVSSALMRATLPIEVRGARFLPREGGALLVCNHQGYFDPLFLQTATTRTVHYMMTSDFYDIPAAQWFFRLCDAIRVPTGRNPRVALEGALQLLGQGWLVGVFPEGRLSRDGNFGRILPGAAYLASRGGVPVVPARIQGSIEVLPHGRWVPRQAKVSIRFGEPRRLSRKRREASKEILAAWESL